MIRGLLFIFILFTFSCEKELTFDENYFVGVWKCELNHYSCRPEVDIEDYKGCYFVDTYFYDYTFKKNGMLYFYSKSIDKYDTLRWAINGATESLLIYKDGALGLNVLDKFKIDSYGFNDFLFVEKSDGVNIYYAYEYNFIRS